MDSSAFCSVLEEHRGRYPRMAPRDLVKLAYQSEFGPAHMVEEGAALLRLESEWRSLSAVVPEERIEGIGNGLCRYHLSLQDDPELELPLLARLFTLTARGHAGTLEGLEEKLRLLEGLDVPGMEEYLTQYRGQGCPAVSHSETYRQAYHPHYRVIREEYARLVPALRELARLERGETPVLVGVEGCCGSGKTLFTRLIQQLFDCRVIYTDDYYLPMDRREENWRETPGGNMDFLRLKGEVLDPATRGQEIAMRPYSCQRGDYGPVRLLPPKKLTVVEGNYCLHPKLEAEYHRVICLTCSREEQHRRLREREGDYYPVFSSLWLPLSEAYLERYVTGREDLLTVDTGV